MNKHISFTLFVSRSNYTYIPFDAFCVVNKRKKVREHMTKVYV